MSELVEFTAEEMKGVPRFRVEYGSFFNQSDGVIISASNYVAPSFKCNPMDRCKAICKHLFELMPQMNYITSRTTYSTAFITESDKLGLMVELSISPFLHCNITEITREQVMG